MSTNAHTRSTCLSASRGSLMPSPRGNARPTRPAQLDDAIVNQIEGGTDPQIINEISHTSAAVLLQRVHATQTPEIVERVLTLIEHEGIDIIADLWSRADAETLPGMLWRLYMLRMSLKKQKDIFAQYWRLGEPTVTSASAITGVAELPTGEDIARLADSILAGAFTGDFAVALERSSIFTDIVASGMRAHAARLQARSNELQEADGPAASKQRAQRIARIVHNAAKMHAASYAFANGSQLWRVGKLQ